MRLSFRSKEVAEKFAKANNGTITEVEEFGFIWYVVEIKEVK